MKSPRTPESRGHDERGLWHEILAGDYHGRAALFLDRDGVVVKDAHYLGRPQDMRLLPGAADAIARCNSLAIPMVLVTNQSGVGRGYYDWDGFHAVQAALTQALAAAGAHFDAVFACAYHAEARPPFDTADHPWRKPNPGMILAAVHRMGLDRAHSWIIGDKASDIAAGRAAGLEGGVLIGSPQNDGVPVANPASATDSYAVESATSLADAVSSLLKQRRLGAH